MTENIPTEKDNNNQWEDVRYKSLRQNINDLTETLIDKFSNQPKIPSEGEINLWTELENIKSSKEFTEDYKNGRDGILPEQEFGKEELEINPLLFGITKDMVQILYKFDPKLLDPEILQVALGFQYDEIPSLQNIKRNFVSIHKVSNEIFINPNDPDDPVGILYSILILKSGIQKYFDQYINTKLHRYLDPSTQVLIPNKDKLRKALLARSSSEGSKDYNDLIIAKNGSITRSAAFLLGYNDRCLESLKTVSEYLIEKYNIPEDQKALCLKILGNIIFTQTQELSSKDTAKLKKARIQTLELLRNGKVEEAKKFFTQQIYLYPSIIKTEDILIYFPSYEDFRAIRGYARIADTELGKLRSTKIPKSLQRETTEEYCKDDPAVNIILGKKITIINTGQVLQATELVQSRSFPNSIRVICTTEREDGTYRVYRSLYNLIGMYYRGELLIEDID